jgi:alpha-ribazole phosphatase
VWQRWQRDRDFRPEGGETLAEVDRRIAAACEDLFAVDGAGARRPDGDVVVVSHVSPIKAAVAWALGTVDLYWRLHLRTASVTRIGWNRGAPILHAFNEVAVAPRRHVAPGSAGA